MIDEDEPFNDFGHTRCPQCQHHWRYMTVEHGNHVFCGECGFFEPATRANSNEHSAAELEDNDESSV